MSHFRPLALPVRALLFQHLAAMEKAGVPPDRAYALLDLGPGARDRVRAFQGQVARGIDPPTAGANSGLFSLFETRLLRAAFSAGSPFASYQRLARHLATASAQATALRARMVMPVMVLLIALCVAPLPQLISGALSTGAYAWRVISPLLLLGAGAVLVVRTHTWFTSGAPAAGRPQFERFLLGVPVFGSLHLRRNARDFIESLALLLEAGLPMFDALPVALETVDNHLVRQDLATLLPAVRSGATLTQAIGTLSLVDTTALLPFVQAGEGSGSLPELLMRHADAETILLDQAQAEIMTWLPRVFYSGVALWMIAHLLAPVF